jgi:hypothetical protein
MNRFLSVSMIAFAALLIAQVIMPASVNFFDLDTVASVLPKLRADYIQLEGQAGAPFAQYYVNMFFLSFLLSTILFCGFIVFVLPDLPAPPAGINKNYRVIQALFVAIIASIALAYAVFIHPTPFYSPGKSLVFSVSRDKFALVFVAMLNFLATSIVSLALFLVVQYTRATLSSRKEGAGRNDMP